MPAAIHAPVKKSVKPAKGKTPKKSTAKQAPAGLVAAAKTITTAAQARAESLLAEIARRKDHIAEAFYDIGLALVQLSKKKLYVALGYGSFDELLQKRNVMNTSTARGLVRLVTTMTREQALAYGQEKAIALIGYATATPALDTPKTLMETGQLPDGKPVAEASVRDIKQAARRVRAAQGKAAPLSPEAKSARAEAKALATWLRSRGAAKATVTPVRAKGAHVLHIELTIVAAARLRSS
jgi:hypothetical protein